jgi:hypothetical protein
LRRNDPRVVCGAVEPAGCQVLAGKAITRRSICCRVPAMAASRRCGNRSSCHAL